MLPGLTTFFQIAFIFVARSPELQLWKENIATLFSFISAGNDGKSSLEYGYNATQLISPPFEAQLLKHWHKISF